ncbi:MAG: SDR family NAD(P)-dependent oxidoreductase, partial [Pseudomonadota bacterium]
MNLTNKTVLVTGANRGIGRATVDALLSEGVKKIYAAARDINTLPDFGDARVSALQLDITDAESVAAAARTASDIDVLINNAGVLKFGSLLDMPRADIEADFVTNFYGTLDVIR